MRAVWFEGGKAELRSVDDPVPAQGEALIQVSLAGICNTDLELLEGYADFTGIPGHEFVGTVIDGPPGLVGRRVVADINIACGGCSECQRNNPHHCRQRKVLGIRSRPGAFAEIVALPVTNLYPVPDQVSDHQAVFAEPLAAADAAVQEISGNDDPVLVVGAGKLGLLVAQCLLADGRRVFIVQRQSNPDVLPHHGDLAFLVASEIPEHSFSVAIECTGNPHGAGIALRGLRPRGKLVLKSTYTQPLELDTSEVVVNELRLVGSRCGSMQRGLERLSKGRITIDTMIAATYPLEQVVEALDQAAHQGTLKVLLDPT